MEQEGRNMSECVVRMEMPKDCWDCPCVNGEYGYCQVDKEERQIEDTYGRPSWCPIICSIPEGHGRLVDADALRNQLIKSINLTNGFDTSFRETATIVPAERSEA